MNASVIAFALSRLPSAVLLMITISSWPIASRTGSTTSAGQSVSSDASR
jgi:hypothetical protein